MRTFSHLEDRLKRHSIGSRLFFIQALWVVLLLTIIARLFDIQILHYAEFSAKAQAQHFGGLTIPARRGEIYGRNSKTGEKILLATNITLDLVYVDPYITTDPDLVAHTLANLLVTPTFHTACSRGDVILCPRELVPYYPESFDLLSLLSKAQSGTLLEPLPSNLLPPVGTTHARDIQTIRDSFAEVLSKKISLKHVTYVPLQYGATKEQMQQVLDSHLEGITVRDDLKLIYADPEEISDAKRNDEAQLLASILKNDPLAMSSLLRSRPLRYVQVFRQIPPEISLQLKQIQLRSLRDTIHKRSVAKLDEREGIVDPLRSIALIPEHWRYYPDATVGSQVVGFLNTLNEAQYGIERTFDAQLRGHEGVIRTLSAEQGGAIARAESTVVDARDGDSIVLTIDPFIQKAVEEILMKGIHDYKAETAQAIVMDPRTGRVLAMANAPTFDRNNYASVYDKEPILIDSGKRGQIAIEIYDPRTNTRVVRDWYSHFTSPAGYQELPLNVQQDLTDLKKLYDLPSLSRYYLYIGEHAPRIEIFPTSVSGAWLKYKNVVGVGAYLNRTINTIFEPGSVMKPITVSIAVDKGEILPTDTYDDNGPVKVDEYVIKNALLTYYGKVTISNCLEFSINTCLTSISEKLGKKLFPRMLQTFGFGKATGIELDDELPGEIPEQNWSNALLATAAFGQGVSVTPLQMITAFAALGNGGNLMKPTIIDSTVTPAGESTSTPVTVLDRVISQQTSADVTKMLISSGNRGFAAKGRPKGYLIAAKTGTSQIAGPGGKYETGTGSNINTFIGYAPVENPQFIILTKYDRPTLHRVMYAESTSAPTFKAIADFLFSYYGIQPDEVNAKK